MAQHEGQAGCCLLLGLSCTHSNTVMALTLRVTFRGVRPSSFGSQMSVMGIVLISVTCCRLGTRRFTTSTAQQ